MKRMTVWWLIVCVQVVIYLAMFHFGLFPFMWINDVSKLSILNMVINWIGTFLIGRWTHQKLKGKQIREQDGWFLSEIPFKIGMLGTVIGFTGMVAFTIGSVATGVTPEMLQGLVTVLCQHLGTALLPTGVGIYSNIVLTILMNNLEGIDSNEKPR